MILFTALAGILFGLFLSENISDTYTYKAASSVCVSYTPVYQEQVSGSTILLNYAEVATSNRVCEYASSLLNNEISADQIKNNISISINANSSIMKITASSSIPSNAIKIANAAAMAYVEQITVITGNSAIQILDTAKNISVQSGNEKRNVLLAFPIAAVFLVCIWIAGKELFSGKIVSVYQCFDDENEVLTIIPYQKKKGR